MKFKFLFFALVIIFSACSNPPTMESIQAIAEQVQEEDGRRINNDKAKEYIAACIAYAEAYPEKEESPKLLFKAAETAKIINQYDQSLDIYDMVLNNFSQYERASEALFLKAFTLDDNLGKKEDAKKLYEEFLEKHPKNQFAESARFMLQNLYKSDEEIIRDFEAKRAQQEEAAKTEQ